MLGLLDALELDRVRLAGHDYGGIVGFLLCLRAPERIARFLALNTYHPWLTVPSILANLPREWYPARHDDAEARPRADAEPGAPRRGGDLNAHVVATHWLLSERPEIVVREMDAFLGSSRPQAS